jgi:3-hydroxyisobutyrate dehydrogenase-like beta-hydroxyacid dehydrogenase
MRIGFIGFGEAGSTIAGGLRSAGIDRLFAYDINADSPRLRPSHSAAGGRHRYGAGHDIGGAREGQ